MGFLSPPPERTQCSVVETGIGKVFWPGGQNSKARLWMMEDRTAVICIAGPDGVNRIEFSGIVAAVMSPSKKETTVTLEDGGQIVLDARGCGCGMGAIGSAGPVPGSYDVNRVRADWYSTVA